MSLRLVFFLAGRYFYFSAAMLFLPLFFAGRDVSAIADIDLRSSINNMNVPLRDKAFVARLCRFLGGFCYRRLRHPLS
jgi:hypothetical protein